MSSSFNELEVSGSTGLEVRQQLRRMLSSAVFARAPQMERLLTFLVEQALGPHSPSSSGKVKEYAIGVGVFGRDPSFDPSTDNIVRMEVRRLRSKLQKYYEKVGITDPLVISVPKGTYTPVFERRDCPRMADQSGSTVSHYRLSQRIHVNRYLSVYEAECLNLSRPVVMMLPSRITLDDQQRRERLLQEIRAGASVHPSAATIFDIEATDTRVLIAAEHPRGRTLRQYVQDVSVTPEFAFDLGRQLAAALAAGHRIGLANGLLTPDWVMIDQPAGSGTSMRLQIPPFGLASLIDPDDTALASFRPPEDAGAARDGFRSDVWMFGALLWFACTGSPPPQVTGDLAGIALQSMPAELVGIVARCLLPDPALRYANAGEIAEDLNTASDDSEIPDVDPPGETFLPDRGRVLFAVVSVLLLLVVAITILIMASKPSLIAKPRVAVLPFENLGGNPENEAYGRGVAELVSGRLARLAGVSMISSRSFSPSGADQHSQRFWREKLRADYVVEGTLIKSETHFHATARLIRVADGTYAWNEDYTGEWANLFDVFDELAGNAARAMGLIVQPQPDTPIRSSRVDMAAYEALVKGRFSVIQYWNTHKSEEFGNAERRLRQALDLNPRYTDAMVELAQLYESAAYPPDGKQRELFDKAQGLADAALELDPGSGPAHSVRGGIYVDTGHAQEGLPHLRLAMQTSPQDPMPYNNLALAYEAMGFWEASLAERQKAVERDPLLRGIVAGGSPLLMRLGRTSEAFQRISTMEKESPDRVTRLAYLHLLNGEPEKAEAILKQQQTGEPSGQGGALDALLALAQAMQGHSEIAKEIVRQISTTERYRGDSVILLSALAGDKDLTIRQIGNNAFANNFRWVVSQPLLRPYRNYPPFQKLVSDLYAKWKRNIADLGPSLSAYPPAMLSAEEYLHGS